MPTELQRTSLRIGDVKIDVSATREEHEPFKGIIKTVPGLIHALICYYSLPEEHVSEYFTRKLAVMEFIVAKSDVGITLYSNRSGWEITDKGVAYVKFLCGEISE